MVKNKAVAPISGVTFLILSAGVILGRFLLPRWLTYDVLSILSWDVFGYYLYLPAKFIYHDLGISDFSWLQQILDKYGPTIGFYQAYMGPEEHYILKYPMGMAILFSPFFFLAHWLAGALGYVQDGFSLPYQFSIAMGCLIYTVIGIWFLRKILIRYFSDVVTSVVMVLLILGTNFFQLTAYDGAMVHNTLFAIYALIIWFTMKWHETPKWRFAIPLGLFVGLAVLIRPTEIISALIPLLWGIWNKDTLQKKLSLVTSHWSQVIGMGLCVLLVGSVQLIYWKIYSGRFLYYSYEEGEGLRFLAPYIMFVLFSWKKGWLIYAPMMCFPVAGFIFLWRQKRELFWAAFLFFTVNLLIVSSWTTWWYGGSLGQRSLMQSYALLAIPFGAFITWIFRRRIWLKLVFFVVAAFFIWLNLFQTWQYMTWIIDPSRMTKEYYWAIFGRTHVEESSKKLLEVVETSDREFLKEGQQFTKRVLANYTFEYQGADQDPHLSRTIVKAGSHSYQMDSTVEFSPGIKVAYNELAAKEGSWLRVTLFVYPTVEMKESPANLVVTMTGKENNYKYKSIQLADDSLKVGEWNPVSMDYEIPFVTDAEDVLAVYIWNRGKQPFYMDDLLIELLEPVKE
ncbi:MAG: glycosyltransferase family 39 protein [bacterium]